MTGQLTEEKEDFVRLAVKAEPFSMAAAIQGPDTVHRHEYLHKAHVVISGKSGHGSCDVPVYAPHEMKPREIAAELMRLATETGMQRFERTGQ